MAQKHEDAFAAKGGWLVVMQFALMSVVVASGPLWGRIATSPLLLAGGAVLIFVGGYFGIGGLQALGRNRTVFPKPRADGELVQGGVFKFVRHPLYASLIHLGLGWALLWQSWITAAVSLVMTAQLYQKSLREEAWLREKFPDYAAYAKRVKRFIPRLWLW
jgi:protein-S-isoprenylcysteine O-methyltransferase Ste14